MPRFLGSVRMLRALLAMLVLAGVLVRGAPLAEAGGRGGRADLALIAALGGTICHQDGGGQQGAPGVPARPHMPDCAVCPICVLALAPHAVLAGGIAVPPRRAVSVPAWLAVGPAQTLVVPAVLVAQARGPPVLI